MSKLRKITRTGGECRAVWIDEAGVVVIGVMPPEWSDARIKAYVENLPYREERTAAKDADDGSDPLNVAPSVPSGGGDSRLGRREDMIRMKRELAAAGVQVPDNATYEKVRQAYAKWEKEKDA